MKYLILFILFTPISYAITPTTTHLMSTAGTGVGSVLLNESAVLNPAPIAFFQKSSFYYQNYTVKLQDENSQRSTDGNSIKVKRSGDLFIVNDTSSPTHGGVAYHTYDGMDYSRKKYSISFAKAYAKDSSFGMIYNYIKDEFPSAPKEEFHQVVFGTTHIISNEFSVGVIIIDPFKTKVEDTRVIFGAQYGISSKLSLICDVGTNYTKTVSESSLVRGALQVSLIQGLFIRFGMYGDKNTKTKGEGYGISWISPKLSVELAVRNSTSNDDEDTTLYADETLHETALTMTLTY
ncbi:MAG: hypothetical protein ACI9QD_000307 [Thermoproteota archaeon]|jgi:hypothetical protein